MTRYIKQKDNFSCGPVAAINICKWAGIKQIRSAKPILAHVKWWRRFTNCNGGTWPKDLNKFLHKIRGIKVKHLHCERLKLRHIDEWIDRGGAIIIHFFHNDPGFKVGHYITIVGRTKKYYYVTNYSRRKPGLSRVSRKRIAVDVSMSKGEQNPLTWFISKA